ncbi:MAG: polymer-forming cytoskeletal protein [Salinibacter sp.]
MANQSSAAQDQVNLVGEGTVLEGTLRAENDVRTSGRIIGTLRVRGKAIVADGGAVEGEIYAVNADIAGHVEGEIHVEERLVLKSSAQVDGRIETDRLVVEEGAQFTGECKMDGSVSVDDDAPDVGASSRSQPTFGADDAAPEAPDRDAEEPRSGEAEEPSV